MSLACAYFLAIFTELKALLVTTPLAAADGEQGASRFNGRATAHPSPTAVPRPISDVDCGVEVAINNESTLRTRMGSHTQAFRNGCSTSATFLRCPTWIDSYKLAAGAFCLACEYVDESAPSGIQNLFGEIAPSKSFDIEVLNLDCVVPFDQIAGDIVVKLKAFATYLIVLRSEQEHCFASPSGAAFTARDLALGSPKLFLRRLEESGILDRLAIREHSEHFDADIDTNRLARG